MRHNLIGALFAAALMAPVAALAQATLTVTTIDESGNAVTNEYTSEELLAMDAIDVETDNDYISETATFTGPRLRDLLGAENLAPEDQIEVTALNDYQTVIPAEEVMNYDVIVAVHMNGEPMSVREKGPYWVIYPMSEFPELQDPGFNDRLVWQLSRVELLKD